MNKKHELSISILKTKRNHEKITLSHLAEWKVKNTEAISIKEDTIKQLTRSIELLEADGVSFNFCNPINN